MEGIPEYVDYNEILQTFLQIDGVVRVHNLRIWVCIALWNYREESS
jgi:Co/Zn/Cd efflux system component